MRPSRRRGHGSGAATRSRPTGTTRTSRPPPTAPPGHRSTTNLSTDDATPTSRTSGHGITGTTDGAWVDLTATRLPAGTTAIRFRYWADAAAPTARASWSTTSRSTARLIGTAETPDEGWTFETKSIGPNTEDPVPGFSRQKETVAGALYEHFYIAENRQYDGYDESLRTAYNFGFAGATPNRPDWVETYPYMDGLLVWYWDTQYSDNNVGDHPGHG